MHHAICLDLDGTITTQEILPRIARELDLYEEIRLLTEATMKGVLSFEKSFKLRCRLLADVPLSRVREIIADTPLQPDIEAFIAANRERCFVATGNLDAWIQPLVDRLGCAFFSSEAQTSGDRLTGVARIVDKGDAVRQIEKRFPGVIAVGDGINDAPMFEAASVSIAYSGVHDAVPALVDLADFVVTEGKALCRLLAML